MSKGGTIGIPINIQRLLWARSGGYCQKPDCRQDLFRFFSSDEVVDLGELAHIIGQRCTGPRGRKSLTKDQIDNYDNVLVLCPTCHTLIDKTESNFPDETLREWKRRHENDLAEVFQVPKYKERGKLATEVHNLLGRNKGIYDQYGPHCAAKDKPLAEEAHIWSDYVRKEIIPNNRRISALLLKNFHLLEPLEKDITNKFVLHREGLELNYLTSNKSGAVPLFPAEMNEILKGEH